MKLSLIQLTILLCSNRAVLLVSFRFSALCFLLSILHKYTVQEFAVALFPRKHPCSSLAQPNKNKACEDNYLNFLFTTF